MLVTFPRSIMLDPSGFGDMNQLLTFGLDGPGLNGLGQCTDVDENGNYIPCAAPASGGVADTSNDVTGVLTPTLSLDSLPTLTSAEQTNYNLSVTPAATAPIGKHNRPRHCGAGSGSHGCIESAVHRNRALPDSRNRLHLQSGNRADP